MPFSEVELGDLGEDRFQQWAKEAHMVTTTPDRDLKGWDRYVEWDLKEEEIAASLARLDPSDCEVKALVQVKTTTGQPGSYPLSLKNCRSLIGHQGPSFLAVLEVDEGEMTIEPRKVYLIHLWEEHIARYTERVTERERGGDSKESQLPRHKATLTISYRDAEPLESPYPQALRAALSAPVRNGSSRYTQEKIRLKQSVGYPDGQQQFVLRINSEVPREYKSNPEGHFADVLLGRADLINPQVEHADVRFGYRSTLQGLPKGTNVKVQAQKQKRRLQFDRGGYHREHVDAYMQDALIRDGKDGFSGGKLRYTFPRLEEPPGPLGELTITAVDKGVRYNLNYNIPGEEPIPLNLMKRVISVAWFMIEGFEAGESVLIKQKPTGGQYTELDALRDDLAASGSFADELRTPDGLAVRKVVDSACDLARHAGMPEETPVQLGQLRRYETLLSLFGSLKTLSEGGDASTAFYCLTQQGTIDSEIEKAFEGEVVALTSFSSFQLGEWVVTIAFAAAGSFMKMCEAAGKDSGKDKIWPEEGRNAEEARGLLNQLSLGEAAYKIEVSGVDYLRCQKYDSSDEVPGTEVLLKEAETVVEDRYERLLLLKEDGVVASFTDSN